MSFIFKHFIIQQDKSPMKIGTDAMILGAWVDPKDARHILDIGTGTGVLALMMAQKSKAQIDAVELDENAFLQAKENFENSSWSYRLKAFHTSIQDFHPPKKYDLIISNPPYFGENFKSIAESEKYRNRKHARSVNSLSFTDLALSVSRLLENQGIFYVILPAGLTKDFIIEGEKQGLYLAEQLEIFSKSGQPPIRVISGFRKTISPVNEDKLVIYEQNGDYTDAYINLTRDYYSMDMAKRKKNPNQAVRQFIFPAKLPVIKSI
jgi:tRNA1Val (adenine37-N6)-methyltransferase